MMRKVLWVFAVLLVLAGSVMILTLRVVDRAPYTDQPYYAEMSQRLDSLDDAWRMVPSEEKISVGWAKASITPEQTLPLAGYGARKPKTMEGVMDSTFVRAIVLKQGKNKVALVTADLLIFPPEVSRELYRLLAGEWTKHSIFLTATHTHSGVGGWAPGMVGDLFAGAYDPAVVLWLAQQTSKAIREAAANTETGEIWMSEQRVPRLINNRLVDEKGIVDPHLRTLRFDRSDATALWAAYSAHATCLDHRSKVLSGDYPVALVNRLEKASEIDFAAFGAGAVGSMGPTKISVDQQENKKQLANELAQKVMNMPFKSINRHAIQSFSLPLSLGEPQAKVTENLALRPYLFDQFFGDYQSEISVVIIGDVLMIGLPVDFSGELAVPLYTEAEKLGLELIIHSFNGDYNGYAIRDKWYDLDKYEARTMSWYGPELGSYLSEIIENLMIIVHEHSKAETARQ